MAYHSLILTPFKLIKFDKILSIFGEKLGLTATISCHNSITGKTSIHHIQRIQGDPKKIVTTFEKIAKAEMIATTDISVERSGFPTVHGFHFWPKGTINISNEQHAVYLSATRAQLEDLEAILTLKNQSVLKPH